MAERIKYYRAQIIPNNYSSMVYWAERHDGENFDIHESDIPIGAIVTDKTYMCRDVEYRKTKNGFLHHQNLAYSFKRNHQHNR